MIWLAMLHLESPLRSFRTACLREDLCLGHPDLVRGLLRLTFVLSVPCSMSGHASR